MTDKQGSHNDPNKRRSYGGSRRDFLGMLGAALGGVTLAGCGGSGTIPVASYNSRDPFRGAPIPNTWQFDNLLPISRAVELGNVMELTPSLGINANGQIFFYAITSNGYGIYEADITTRSSGRAVTALRPIVQTGASLPDGRTVARLGNFDFNDSGSVGFIVKPPYVDNPATDSRDTDAEGVYLERNGGVALPLLVADQAIGGSNSVGGVFTDVDVTNGDNVLAVGLVDNQDADSCKDSVVFVPASGASQVVVSQGDAIPGTSHTVNSVGLIDAGMDGKGYTLELETEDHSVTEENMDATRAVSTRGVPANRSRMMVVNSLGAPFARSRVIHASSRLASTRDVTVSSGSFSFGARMGNTVSSEAHAAIVETNPGVQSLVVNGVTVGAANNPGMTGSTSPRGHRILSLGPPVIGNNLLFFTVITDGGMEIVVTNLQTWKTLIGYGDTIAGKKVNSVAFGWHPDQVNLNGTLVMYAEMTDGSQAILQGSPS